MFHYLENLDGNTLLYIQDHMRNPILTHIFRFITALGNEGLIWLLIIVGLLIYKKSRMTGLVALINFIMSIIINNIILKNVIARPRPFDTLTHLQILISRPTDYSFPSGHTAISFAVAGAIYLYGSKKWGTIALILAGAIGFSRLYLGVHYPSDVIGGALIGILISIMVSKFFVHLQERQKEKATV